MSIKKKILLASLSGLLLQISFPPLGLYPALFLSFVPVTFALNGIGLGRKIILGIVVGFFAYTDFLWSLASWGSTVQLAAITFGMALFSATFVLTHYYEQYLPLSISWLSMPISWMLVAAIFEDVFAVPASLSFTLSLDADYLLPGV